MRQQIVQSIIMFLVAFFVSMSAYLYSDEINPMRKELHQQKKLQQRSQMK